MKEIKKIKLGGGQLVISLLLVGLLELFCYYTAVAVDGGEFFKTYENLPMAISLSLCCVTFVPHEWLHCAGWNWAGRESFTVNVKYQLPFRASSSFCGEMPVKTFLVGTLLPFAVLSVIPCMAGIVAGCVYPVWFGMICMTGCCEDILLAARMLPYLKSSCKVTNLPNETGVALVKETV